MSNNVCALLGIRYPILQGAMTLVTDVGLVSAVSNAGGLGIYAGGIDNIDIEYMREQIRGLKKATSKPFGFNIVLSSQYASQLVDLVCEESVPVITTGAGSPAKHMGKLKEAGIIVAPVVPSKKVAQKMEAAGADMLVVEGMESGGFIGGATTMALIPQVVDAVSIPVVAAGGIADGRGMAAAFMLGAQGIQMGTRFLASQECAIADAFKDAVVKAELEDAMVVGTRIGTPMQNRTLRNTIAEAIKAYEITDGASIEEYDRMFVEARNRFVKGDADMSLLGLGQGVGLVNRVQSVSDIIRDIVREYNQAIAKAVTL